MAAIDALRANVKRIWGERAWKDLAEGIDVTPSMISQFLNGHRGVPIDTAERIAKFLGVPLSELLTDFTACDPSRHTADKQSQASDGKSGGVAYTALTPGELRLVEWFRGLDARKQAAALQFIPLFGALDGVQARHLADAKSSGAHDEPATDPTVRASLRQAETPIALARKQR
jgi:transcriptional regulator with XRE-family HTH domain